MNRVLFTSILNDALTSIFADINLKPTNKQLDDLIEFLDDADISSTVFGNMVDDLGRSPEEVALEELKDHVEEALTVRDQQGVMLRDQWKDRPEGHHMVQIQEILVRGLNNVESIITEAEEELAA